MPDEPKASIPQRVLLSDQVVECLRSGLATGRWTGDLPSEAALCREFQVSRVTLRKALAQLTQLGWISSRGRGRPHRIRRRPRSADSIEARTIRVLSPYSFWKLGGINHLILEALSERLAASGLRIEYERRPRLFEGSQSAGLERLRALPDTAGWVLFYSSEAMQRWFNDSGLPCVVFGNVYEGIKLPCLPAHSDTTARHAAGKLYARGHRSIVHLMASFTSLGDRLGAEAFRNEALRLGANVQTIVYSGNPRSVSEAAKAVLAIRPRPTAIYMSCPEDSVTTLCQLHQTHLRIPEDIELLVGWTDPILSQTIPTIAHYQINGSKFGRKMGDLMLARIRGEHMRAPQMFPEFVPGGSLADRSAGFSSRRINPTIL